MRDINELKLYIQESKNKIINLKDDLTIQKRNLKQYEKELKNLEKGRALR